MTNTINQTWNDTTVNTFYWMEANCNSYKFDNYSEAMYTSIAWIEDDNECTYWSLTNHNHTTIMSITVDRIVATCLLSKATTGNEILAVLDMITSTFNQPITPSMMEMIKSWC